jgi:transcriptional regulator with XRE-family HTH domain
VDSQDLMEIRKIRLGYSQQEMADHLGTGLRQYQKWEAGDAPIRPMVAKGVENIVQLVEFTRLARQSKNLQAKCDLQRAALKQCLDQFLAMGASADKIESIELVLAQSKAPSEADLQKLFDGIENPAEISEMLKAMTACVFSGIDSSMAEAQQVEAFKAALVDALPSEYLAKFKRWAAVHFVKTNADPLISVFKALAKQKQLA